MADLRRLGRDGVKGQLWAGEFALSLVRILHSTGRNQPGGRSLARGPDGNPRSSHAQLGWRSRVGGRQQVFRARSAMLAALCQCSHASPLLGTFPRARPARKPARSHAAAWELAHRDTTASTAGVCLCVCGMPQSCVIEPAARSPARTHRGPCMGAAMIPEVSGRVRRCGPACARHRQPSAPSTRA
jgi:hypothetical protein